MNYLIDYKGAYAWCMHIPYNRRFKILLRMKLTLIALLLFLLQATASVRSQTLTLHFTDEPLEIVLAEVKKQTGYSYIANAKLLKEATTVTVKVSNSNVNDALKAIFKDQALSAELKNGVIRIESKRSEFEENGLFQNQDMIRGHVTNEKGEPLAGASVYVLDGQGRRTSTQTTTDFKGYFNFTSLELNSKLEVAYLGYTSEQFLVSKGLIKVSLKPIIEVVDEVVVNAGYYSVKDRERTGSISRVTAKEISNQPVTNPLAALIGRMPGVNVVQASGVPGGSVSVEIRGRNTITGSTQPLYIVDGIPFSNEGMGASGIGFILGHSSPSAGVSQYGLSPMVGLNASDIETIEVLKDADATAIYGSRGANGVVLITTKRFQKNQSQFDLRYTQGFGKMVNRYDLLNTEQYLKLRQEAYANGGIDIPATAYDVNGTWDPNRYTDWQEVLVGNVAIQNNLQASLQGGSELTNFVLSGGTFRETLVFPGDYANNKYTMRSVINHQSRDARFKASANVAFAVDKNNFPGIDLNRFAIRLAPNAPALYDELGNLNWENNTWDNPLAETEQKYHSKFDNLSVSLNLSQDLYKGLSLSLRGGVNYGWMDEDRTQPSTMINPFYGIGPESSSIALSSTKRESWIIEPQLTYTKKWDTGLELNTLLGTTFQASSEQYLEQSAFGFTSNALIYDIKSASYHSITANRESRYRYSALYGRFNLGWHSRYFINLTGRRDGSSRFGPGNQFANFGAVGFAWLFSEENLVKQNLPFLTYGKLRGSYGLTGSDNIGDYKYLNTYAPSQMLYEDKIGLMPTGLFNPNFAWETNSKFEGSLEVGFLENRLTVIGSYYLNRSSNQLVGIPLPAVTGFPSIHSNLDATVQNSGFELEISSDNWRSNGFRWNTTFSLTVPKNKLLSFPNLESSTYATQYVVGYPLNILKRYNYLGVDPQTGLYKYEDVDGDGRYTAADRQTILQQDPEFYGGLNNSFNYKGFQLDIFFQFVKQNGRELWSNFSALPGLAFNLPVDALDRWQRTGDIATVQRMANSSDMAALAAFSPFGSSSAIIGDASYIRLKNVNLSYQLPDSWMKGLGASVFAQGQNLWTLTNYNGADPATTGSFNASIAPLRMITLGIQLKF